VGQPRVMSPYPLGPFARKSQRNALYYCGEVFRQTPQAQSNSANMFATPQLEINLDLLIKLSHV
jgi:hypothetical protein